MRRQKLDLSPERQLVTNLIVSDQFLSELAPVIRVQSLQAGYTRQLASWILEYYQQFKKAPGRNIQEVYRIKAKSLDEADADNMAQFLRNLSEDYTKAADIHNVAFEVSQAILYLKQRALELLGEQLQTDLASGDILAAENHVATWNRVVQPSGEGVSILRDYDKVQQAFFDEEETLFTFPGDLGKVCGKFNRGDFGSFLAPMKRGKTWWLWYVAETAIHANCKVVYFTLEMTWKQMVRRAWQSLIASPKDGGKIRMPKFVESGDKWVVEVEEETRDPLNVADIQRTQKAIRRMVRGGDVQIISVPSYSATVEDLDVMLDNLFHYEQFVPDVIVFDYADIILPSKGQADYRHQLDAIWKKLRRMAQQRNALVFTASQAEKSSFKTDIKEGHVAEDIRKLAHVTHMLALNQSKEERDRGIMRVSQLAVREGRTSSQQAVVLQCLDVGRPVVDSRFDDKVDLDENKPAQPVTKAPGTLRTPRKSSLK